jgi:hypothetical protein
MGSVDASLAMAAGASTDALLVGTEDLGRSAVPKIGRLQRALVLTRG